MTSAPTVLIERIERHAENEFRCPDGCGARHLDQPATRYRLLETTTGTVIETMRSVNGGRNWFGAAWQPVGSAYGQRALARLGWTVPPTWREKLAEVDRAFIQLCEDNPDDPSRLGGLR